MMLRTCALFGNSRRVLAVLGLLAITALALAFWSALTSQSVIISGELVRGCHSTLLSEGAVHIAIPWETQVGFDLAIFILTIVRSYKCRNYSLERFRTTKTERVSALGLADLIARDGAIYCGVMVLANIANILTFYIASDLFRGSLSTFSSCISVTMMSRLTLNLHDASSLLPSTHTTTKPIAFAPMRGTGIYPSPGMVEVDNAEADEEAPVNDRSLFEDLS